MSTPDADLLERRKAGFDAFYECVNPELVDFLAKLGFQQADGVLEHAEQYAPYLDQALQKMEVKDQDDQLWLLERVGYFIGEYFAQKYDGHWQVNEFRGSRYFARYVVCQFTALNHPTMTIEPFEIAKEYVDTPVPRHLLPLLNEVEKELKQSAGSKDDMK